MAWPAAGQPDVISIRDASFTGAWGVSIDWSDGHSTGIYAWSVLRRWWDGGLDEPMVIDPIPDTTHPDPAGSASGDDR